MARACVLATLGGDPHTQGLFRVARIARKAGLEAHVLPPGSPLECKKVPENKSNRRQNQIRFRCLFSALTNNVFRCVRVYVTLTRAYVYTCLREGKLYIVQQLPTHVHT